MRHIDPELLNRYAAGNCTTEEIQEVETWLESDQDLPISADSNLSQNERSMMESQIWSAIQAERSTDKSQLKLFTTRNLLSVAACVALAISVLVYITTQSTSKTDNLQILVHQAGNGQLDTLLLSDGSRVILNAGAKVQYPKDFNGKSRELSLLEGEAFFEVQKNPAKPFIVHTDQTTVRVLGTKFNINKSNKEVAVTLKEGKVAFNYKHESVMLTPGQRALYTPQEGIGHPENVDIERYVSWQLGTLWFEDTPMDEVLHRLAQRYNLEFKIEHPGLHDLLFTGKIKSKNETEALKLIMMSSEIKFKSMGSRILKVY